MPGSTYPAAMKGVSYLVSVMVTAAVLTAAPVEAATAAGPAAGTIVSVKLELEASNGFEALFETSEDGVATLKLFRGESSVTYAVKGAATEEGLKVRFGRLGLIDVAFTPTTTLNTTEPPEGCTGEPRTLREGIFTGAIHFTGEREYVRIEAPQAAGEMSVISQWVCPESEDMAPFVATSQALDPGRQKAEQERGSASLFAFSRRCSCLFSAGIHHRNSGGGSVFFGGVAERHEGMRIERGAYFHAGGGAFAYDHAAGTATLRPPRPLSGYATFERRPGRDLWRSTIRVPLPGRDPLRTDGPGFRAGLYPEYQFH